MKANKDESMIRVIIQLLPKGQRKRGIWVAFSVLLRAILDFAGVAALIPILLVVMKQNGGRGMMLALYIPSFIL